MIDFKYLRWQNFMSYGQGELAFVNGSVPTLVMGENRDSISCDANGVGKSAIFEALVWCIYGQTLRGLASKEVQRDGIEKCSVYLDFQIGSDDYEIARHQGHKGNAINFAVNGQPPKDLPKDKRLVQKYIEDVIGMDFKLFCESVILGQDSLSFATATDAEKKIVLERAAQTEVFEKCCVEVKARLEGIQTEESLVEGTLNQLDLQITNSTENIQREREVIAEFEQAKALSIHGLEEQVLDLADEAKVARIAQEEYTGKVTAIQKVKENLLQQKRVLQTSISELERQLGGLEVGGVDTLIRITALERKIESVLDTCPTCNRPFDANAQEAARQSFRDELVAEQAKRDAVADKMQALQPDVRSLAEQMTQLDTQIAECGQAEQQLAALKVKADGLSILNARIDTAKRNLTLEMAKIAPAGRMMEQEEKLRGYEKEKKDMEVRRRELATQSHHLSFWVKGFGKKGVRCYMLDHVANSLNNYAAKYSQYLTDGEIDVTFSTQRTLASGEMTDDFRVQGINKLGADVYIGNSKGERERIDIVVSLALQDLIRSTLDVHTNLFVADEGTAHIDAEGSVRIMRLLQDLAKEGKSVWYISHDSSMQNLFSRRVVAIKEDGLSRLVNDQAA